MKRGSIAASGLASAARAPIRYRGPSPLLRRAIKSALPTRTFRSLFLLRSFPCFPRPARSFVLRLPFDLPACTALPAVLLVSVFARALHPTAPSRLIRRNALAGMAFLAPAHCNLACLCSGLVRLRAIAAKALLATDSRCWPSMKPVRLLHRVQQTSAFTAGAG